eukprot:scaffold304871_cov23-Tisochrysis_lutea.AAC.1
MGRNRRCKETDCMGVSGIRETRTEIGGASPVSSNAGSTEPMPRAEQCLWLAEQCSCFTIRSSCIACKEATRPLPLKQGASGLQAAVCSDPDASRCGSSSGRSCMSASAVA